MLPFSYAHIADKPYKNISSYTATVSDVNSFFSLYEISNHFDELTSCERIRWFRLTHSVSLIIRNKPFDSRVPRLVCFSILLFFSPNEVEDHLVEVHDYE